MIQPSVAVLDYGSGNVHSVVRALTHVGAEVELTADRSRVLAADGLLVPGVGNFHACMAGLRAADGPSLIDTRLAGGRPVLGICVGLQVLFARGSEHGVTTDGIGLWPGDVRRLHAPVIPHMGWDTVEAPAGSAMFAGIEDERFYFVHSYAAHTPPAGTRTAITTHGEPFVAAVEDGTTWATQFHPEKSGDAGARLLANWVTTLD